MKKRIVFLILTAVAFIIIPIMAEPNSTPQEIYIRKYAPIAVAEMYRSGVPASITLAQGLLESRYGQSTLAVDGNNHFGIKCHDWTGKKMYYDDDRKGECFRVYRSADESFRDHSDFLRYRDRYKPLFDNDITDYKSWAKGLKKAGYATDPSYSSKLIKIIEDYRLYEYDKMSPADFGETQADNETGMTRKERRAARRAARTDEQKPIAKTSESENNAGSLPESPLELEEPHKVNGSSSGEVFSFSLKRQLYTKNGVPFVYSLDGETYGTIASSYHLFTREILRFNDVRSDSRLAPGTVVYLQAKKNRTQRGLDKYISDEGGESMRDLSQRFAVKLKDLCKMNSLPENYITRPGDELNLR